MKTVLKKILVRLYTRFQLKFLYRFAKVGRRVRLDRGLFVLPGIISIGDHVYIGRFSYLAVPAKIGNFVMFASSVALIGDDHEMARVGTPMTLAGRGVPRPIVIEDDVWIGHGAIIRSGVRIGEGAVIGAGSIVTKDIPPYSIAVGSPARVIRQRFNLEDQALHAASLKKYREIALGNDSSDETGNLFQT